MRTSLSYVAVVGCLLAAGCARPGPAAGDHDIVVGAWPVYDLVRRVVADEVSVSALATEGVEPHDLELDADDLTLLERADAVVYVGAGFQPAIETAVAGQDQPPAFDVLELAGIDAASGDESGHGSVDPHVWLSPDRWSTVARRLHAELGRALPDLPLADPASLSDPFGDLESAFDPLVAGESCARRHLFTEHAAFGYLPVEQLEQVALTGLSPEAEVTAQRLDEVAQLARETGATTVFAERGGDQRLAKALASEADLEVRELDPLERAFGDETYEDRMRANLDAIRRALGC